MCKISKSVDVHAIKEHLEQIIANLPSINEKVTATLVDDERYMSMTAVFGNQVLCINFMQSGKEEEVC